MNRKKTPLHERTHNLWLLLVVSVSSALNSRSDWLLGFNEFKMAAGVVIRIQDGGP